MDESVTRKERSHMTNDKGTRRTCEHGHSYYKKVTAQLVRSANLNVNRKKDFWPYCLHLPDVP